MELKKPSHKPLVELGIEDEGEARILFNEKKMRLLEALNPGPVYTSQLKGIDGMSLPLVLYHLKQLIKDGYVGKIDTGYKTLYYTTDKGKQLLQKKKKISERR
jgi:predicted transcriptional regulator